MLAPQPTETLNLRVLLSSAAFLVCAVSAVLLALADGPQVLVVGLSLLAALAMIDVAGVVTCRQSRDGL
jgi:membrane protein YdbS with pleckstrin-like domain